MQEQDLYKKYLNYEESDFLEDPIFQDIALNPTPENQLFRKEVEDALPGKKAAIESALLFLRSIRFKEQLPDEQQIENSFSAHLESLRRAGLLNDDIPSVSPRRLSGRYVRNIAAVMAGAILLAGLSFFLTKHTEEELTVKTGFGETKQVTLPDGSLVELNSNSSIRYTQKWKKKRDVWLEGEALFKVVHASRHSSGLKQGQYFVVHAKGLNVTVLGTVFDVRQRREVTEVVLQKGKVKVSFFRQHLPDIILTPGKRVIYQDKIQKVKEDAVETASYTAWREKKLMLVNPTIREISQYLEDNFGKKVITNDASLDNKMIAGPIPISSLNDALFVISTVSNVDIVRPDSSTILLKSR